MADAKNYINGIFVDRKETQYGEMFAISINDDALETIKKLPKSPKGWHNLNMASKKDDKNKFSVWENTFKPNAGKNGSAPKPNHPSEPEEDLPF